MSFCSRYKQYGLDRTGVFDLLLKLVICLIVRNILACVIDSLGPGSAGETGGG